MISEEILVLLKDVIVLPAARVVLVVSVLHKCPHSFFISCHCMADCFVSGQSINITTLTVRQIFLLVNSQLTKRSVRPSCVGELLGLPYPKIF